jgi:glyoxylase-like metal-dependent hydrolase (beta-lactamase superfamily II)
MRQFSQRIFLEHKHIGVRLGAIGSEAGLLLIDSPLRVEDCREWLAQLAEHGQPRFLVLLDHHIDRVLGARHFDLPIVAHEFTRQNVAGWPDTFKGGAKPIGAEADRLKRLTGIVHAVPEIGFSRSMSIHLGRRRIVLWARPGPMVGAVWVVVPDAKTAFIGDTVTVAEPPYLGEAELDAWLALLDELRTGELAGYRLISSRDGLVEREHINTMARFLRKIPPRLDKLLHAEDAEALAADLAKELVDDFPVAAGRREQALQRVHSGLVRLHHRMLPGDD